MICSSCFPWKLFYVTSVLEKESLLLSPRLYTLPNPLSSKLAIHRPLQRLHLNRTPIPQTNQAHKNMPPATSPPTTSQPVGYIGLGNAGYSLASNLPKSGYHLLVHDSDPAKAQKAASEWPNTTTAATSNSTGVPSPSAFADCEVIITMLPQGAIVRDVLLGPSGIALSLKPGTMIIDTSSSSPFSTHALGAELALLPNKPILVDPPPSRRRTCTPPTPEKAPSWSAAIPPQPTPPSNPP